MSELIYLTTAELEAGFDEIRRSPRNEGVLEMIVRRPATGEREILHTAELDLEHGLVGDSWKARGSNSTPDKSANRDMQLTLMNSRVIALLAREKDRWPLAGDQLYVDMDLSLEHLPPGTQLGFGSAVLEVTAPPHTGCKKFKERFGQEAMQFVNSPVGLQLRLRGMNARIVRAGVVRVGDKVKKILA